MQHIEDGDPREWALRMTEGCLGRRIARLHRLVARRFEAELRESGLTLPQLEVLTELTLSDAPARPSEIAGWLGVERSTISRNLDILAQRGYVRAATTSTTGRTTHVVITGAGLRALADAEPAWRRAQAWISAAVQPGAADTLDGWLAALDLDQQPR